MGIVAEIGVEISRHERLLLASSSDDTLVTSCIQTVEDEFDIVIDKMKIRTFSNLPAARGLKTSSSISCTMIKALLRYYQINSSPDKIIQMSASASIDAGVSITGAIDDAYAAYLGGVSFTENKSRRLITHKQIPVDMGGLEVLLLVPSYNNPKSLVLDELDRIDMQLLKEALEFMRKGRIQEAINCNTSAYAPLLLRDPELVDDLYTLGLDIVGLNGAGPSLFTLVKTSKINGTITNINNSFTDLQLVRSLFRNIA